MVLDARLASSLRGDNQHKTPYRAWLVQFVPGLAPHLHGFALQVNGLTAGYDGTGPSNLYEVLQAAGVDERLLTREDITQKSAKTIPLHLEREVKQYGELHFA